MVEEAALPVTILVDMGDGVDQVYPREESFYGGKANALRRSAHFHVIPYTVDDTHGFLVAPRVNGEPIFNGNEWNIQAQPGLAGELQMAQEVLRRSGKQAVVLMF